MIAFDLNKEGVNSVRKEIKLPYISNSFLKMSMLMLTNMQ